VKSYILLGVLVLFIYINMLSTILVGLPFCSIYFSCYVFWFCNNHLIDVRRWASRSWSIWERREWNNL